LRNYTYSNKLTQQRIAMTLIGPDSFDLRFDAYAFSVWSGAAPSKFSSRAQSKIPKLYVVSVTGELVYVGITKQPIRSRLRLGWAAKGETGYYGYAWRHKLTAATLHVWYDEDARDRSCRDVETIEAEVAFLVRRAGQWPQHQTEIHFYPSSETHREQARRIFDFVVAAS
jgi:hypothetical protein